MKPYSQKTSQSNHTTTTALSNSMKLSDAIRDHTRQTGHGERSDRMWSTGEGNDKPLQCSCLENPINSMKRQNDRILKEELHRSVQFSSVTQSCPILCDPMNRSTPGLPVHNQHSEFTQTHVHRVSDAILPSHPWSSPSPPAPNPSQHQGLFQ